MGAVLKPLLDAYGGKLKKSYGKKLKEEFKKSLAKAYVPEGEEYDIGVLWYPVIKEYYYITAIEATHVIPFEIGVVDLEGKTMFPLPRPRCRCK